LCKFDPEDILSLQARASSIPLAQLDLDYVELSNDIDFLEAQVKYDMGSYDKKGLEASYAKINHYKQRAEVLRIELARRESLNIRPP
jgi:hypothetical protein